MNREKFDKMLEQYESLWGSDKDHYMLSGEITEGRVDINKCAIIDMRSNSILIIEDSDLATALKEKMLTAGVRVGNPYDPEVRKEYIRRRLNQAHER